MFALIAQTGTGRGYDVRKEMSISATPEVRDAGFRADPGAGEEYDLLALSYPRREFF